MSYPKVKFTPRDPAGAPKDEAIDGIAIGQLVVHRCLTETKGKWTVSHAKTGGAYPCHTDKKSVAIKRAELLRDSGANWDAMRVDRYGMVTIPHACRAAWLKISASSEWPK